MEGISKLILACNDINIPVIVRFQGTNATEGIKLINDTSLNIIAESSLNEAAQKAVELSKK